jgi:hypothetical protein
LTADLLSEHRLWTAVVVKAVEDWRFGTMRARRDAQNFLFESDEDFNLGLRGCRPGPDKPALAIAEDRAASQAGRKICTSAGGVIARPSSSLS